MDDQLVAEILECVPAGIRDLPGTALYSGRSAWQGPAEMYLLGFNPGGDPSTDTLTVSKQVEHTLTREDPQFSKYVHEEWRTARGRPLGAGRHAMQVRIREMFAILDMEPGTVPASNIIFARSRQAAHLDNPLGWAEACWPFHDEMIKRLRPRIIVCMGNEAAAFVAAKSPPAEVVKIRHTSRSARTWGADVAPAVQAALGKTA